MSNFKSKETMTKKERKELNNSKRNSWGDVNPVTKVIGSKKAYNRAREKRAMKEADI